MLRPEVSIINLYNERFPRWLKTATEDELLDSPIMLARLLRVALGETKREEERHALDAVGARLESAAGQACRLAGGVRRRVTKTSASVASRKSRIDSKES